MGGILELGRTGTDHNIGFVRIVLGKPKMKSDQVHELVELGRRLLRQCVEAIEICCENSFQDMGKEAVLALEMIVDQRLRNPRVLRDAGSAGGIEPVGGKQFDGRVYQCLFTVHGFSLGRVNIAMGP